MIFANIQAFLIKKGGDSEKSGKFLSGNNDQ